MRNDLEHGFQCGAFAVEPLKGSVTGCDRPSRHLPPKAMEVLVCLAGAAPETLTRQELLDKVWGERFVSDEVLTHAITELRHALGDAPNNPAYIETIPKRGYRLKAPVEQRRSPGTAGEVARPRDESLIVLPLQNLSAGGEDFIADGITELLILRLAGLRNIRVISRTTSMSPATRSGLSMYL